MDSSKSVKLEKVVMNPPYSLSWNYEDCKEKEIFERFGIAPKSKADYAFVLRGLAKMEDSMAVLLPHGVLFRGSAEGEIRKKLIEANLLDAVIGLPEKLFMNTAIPTCILILKRNRERQDIFFMDAKEVCKKDKKNNVLELEHITKIVESYRGRKNIDKLCRNINIEEIKENDYNLNIPRYIDTAEQEILPSFEEILAGMKKDDEEIAKTKTELMTMCDELVTDNKAFYELIGYLKGEI